MESQVPVPHASPEMGVNNPQVLPPGPAEVAPKAPPERAPERLQPQELQSAPVQSMPVLPSPTAPQRTTAPNPLPLLPLAPQENNPTVASDDEVIEKEWVDKAKKIITDTKNDPYRQEKEVSKLQADYLKKRYGKEVKLTND